MNTPTHPEAPTTRSRNDARERAIAILTDRYAEGVLDDVALELRLARLHAAEEPAAIEAVIADIADAGAAPARAAAPVQYGPLYGPPAASGALGAPGRILAVMCESKRTGRWTVPSELRVIAVMSDVKLDLRQALLSPVTVVDVTCVMANVHIVVPPGVAVVFEAGGFMAATGSAAIEPDAWSQGPVLRVVGGAFMAEVRVVVKEPKAR